MPKRTTRPDRWKHRKLRDRLLIVIDAKQTEKQYLQQFSGRKSPTAPDFRIHTKDKDPLQVVTFASEKFNDDFDEAWCVFDQDDYEMNFEQAVNVANKLGIKLAVSCPCFELWLLLHFERCRQNINQKEALRRLRRHVPHFHKTELNTADFEAGIPDAIERAEELESRKNGKFPNPYTGVWKLVKRLQGY